MSQSAQAYRVLRPDDASALAMLHTRAFEAPWSARALREELAKANVFGLGLIGDSTLEPIIAFVLFQRVLDEAEMLTLVTEPAHQRQGRARALLKTAFTHLAERGVSRCLLEVAADNSGALGLYQGLGFSRDGTRKAYYQRAGQTSVDAILMSANMTGLLRT